MARLRELRPLEVQIAEYQQEFTDAEAKWKREQEKYENGGAAWQKPADKPRINWDPEWDGLLVERLQKLQAAGFEIVQFWRKQKIQMRAPQGWNRAHIVQTIEEAVGKEWTGVTFKPHVNVWWGPTKRGWY